MNMISGTDKDTVGLFIGGWFSNKTNNVLAPPYSAIAWLEDNQIALAAVFNDYTNYNIQAHLYGPKKLTKVCLKNIYNYVFKELKCKRLTAQPKRNNKKLLQLLPRIGFKYEATLKNYYGPFRSDDAIVLVLTEETAVKWLH